jgi:hypothetical protein
MPTSQAQIARFISVLLTFELLEHVNFRVEMRRQQAATQRWLNVQLDIHRLSDEDCKKLFRFTSPEV